ncbi:MAG: hypothetical protein IJT94_09920, partial [Oscillibacter sp.]|nr:hypothetical protein [Oscillibacter sp.]
VSPAELLGETYVRLEDNPPESWREREYMKVKDNRGSVSGDHGVSAVGNNGNNIYVTGGSVNVTMTPPPPASDEKNSGDDKDNKDNKDGKDGSDGKEDSDEKGSGKDDSLEKELATVQIEQIKVETKKNRLLITGGVGLLLAYAAYLLIQAVFNPGAPLDWNPFEPLFQLLGG